jgi:hypothetical protein
VHRPPGHRSSALGSNESPHCLLPGCLHGVFGAREAHSEDRVSLCDLREGRGLFYRTLAQPSVGIGISGEAEHSRKALEQQSGRAGGRRERAWGRGALGEQETMSVEHCDASRGSAGPRRTRADHSLKKNGSWDQPDLGTLHPCSQLSEGQPGCSPEAQALARKVTRLRIFCW